MAEVISSERFKQICANCFAEVEKAIMIEVSDVQDIEANMAGVFISLLKAHMDTAIPKDQHALYIKEVLGLLESDL